MNTGPKPPIHKENLEMSMREIPWSSKRCQNRRPSHIPGATVIQLCLLLTIALLASALHAQEYRGVITGQVTDAKGAAIPNASVVATGPQQTYNAITTAKGEFTIPLIQPGEYNISVEAPGFKKDYKQGIIVDVSAKLNLTFSLDVGSVTETISVTADQAAVNTSDASGGSIIDPEQVQNLPMNGREVYSLLTLTPGVKTPPVGNSASELNESNAYSFNGQWGNYNQFALNGAPVSQQNGGGAGTWNISPSVDAVEEFKVMTNTYDAQYGRSSGGTVNTILKSGTPKFHGTLFEYWRNSVLDANSYALGQAGEAKPFHNQNQFGGTVGGPVIGLRKSTYFFFSYEGWREAVPNSVSTTTITPDLLPGSDGSVNLSDYLQGTGKTAIYDPLTTHCAVSGQNPCEQYTRDPFPGNVIPADRISAIGVNLLKLLPLANQPGYRNNYVVSAPGLNRYNQPIARIDHDFSDKTRVYGMFAWWSGTQYLNASGFPGAAAYNGNGIDNYQSTLTQVVDATHTFRPNLFADVRVSFNRAYNLSPDGAESAGLSDVTTHSIGLTMPALPTTNHEYLPEIATDDGALPNFVGNVVNPSIFETYDLAPSVTHVVGRSNLHYGGEVSLYHDVANGIRRANGNFNFGPALTQEDPKVANNDGSSIAGFLLGYPSSGGVEYNDPTYESYKAYAAYIQDDWKVNSRLSLNLGLRFENELSPRDRNGRLQAGFCYTCVNPISSSVPSVTLPNGASFASPIMAGLEFQKNRSPYQNTWGILLPKVGASFSLTNKLVMRGGWGLYRALGFELGGTSTWDTTTSYNYSLDDGLTPNLAFSSGTPFTNGFTTPPGDSQGLASGDGDGVWADSWARKIPYTQQYSFGFQGEARGGIVWDLEFVGAHTVDLRAGSQKDHITPAQFAQGHATPSYLDQQIANPFYGNPQIPVSDYLGSHPTVPVREMMSNMPQYDSQYGPEEYEWNTPWGYSNYTSLVAKAEKRFSGGGLLSNGLSFTTSFTWGKVISATGLLNNGFLVDPGPYYGIDSSDRPFLFSVGGLYKIPIGRGGMLLSDAHGLLDEIAGGWQVNWIVNDQSGTPVSYPNGLLYTCGSYNIKSAHKSWGSYLNNSNPNCFTGFPEYTAITQGPLSVGVRNPWAEQSQVALQKQFGLFENAKLQFRAEAFNLTNTPIFNGPNTSNPNSPIQRQANIPVSQPGAYTGYGTVGPSTQNSPRELQLSLKILF
jgi:Carboxypeptidase regulatory-like domain/TonB-dependent Receptor Plug Domain